MTAGTQEYSRHGYPYSPVARGGEVLSAVPSDPAEPIGAMVVGCAADLPGEGTKQGVFFDKLEVTRHEATKRAEIALDACEYVTTPEVCKAVTGYFDDHLRLATVIEGLVSSSVTGDEKDALLTPEMQTSNPAINEAIDRLLAAYEPVGFENDDQDVRRNQRNTLLAEAHTAVDRVLFREVCLGATLIGDEELSRKGKLYELVDEIAEKEGFITYGKHELSEYKYWVKPYGSPMYRYDLSIRTPGQRTEGMNAGLSAMVEKFGKEMRPAGKLMYHATPFGDEIISNGGIASRSWQANTTGSFRATTRVVPGDEAQHSNAPHWAGFFDPTVSYKVTMYGCGSRALSPGPATIAVPFAKVIEQLPFGRSFEYGIVERKDGASVRCSYAPPVLGEIGFGATDHAGSEDRDRVFYASPSDPRTAATYKLDLGSPMVPADGANCCYVITTDEQLNKVRLSGWGVGFDGYPLEPQFPKHVNIQAGDDKKGVERAIAAIEAQSQASPPFDNRAVVPLRQGVFTLCTESPGGSDWFEHAGRNTGNVNIVGGQFNNK